MKATKHGSYVTIGRRKQSTARLYLKPGTGSYTVNGKPLQEYFGVTTSWGTQALVPINILKQEGLFDLTVNVKGGGVSGQSGAISLALARALDGYAELHGVKQQLEAVNDNADAGDSGSTGGSSAETALLGMEGWHAILKENGCLTRDSRVVLRKKVGLVKARKAKQFSKR